MICPERKILMVHPPKTGGSSLTDMIWPGLTAMNHKPAAQYKPQHWNKFFVFGFVRHPIDRAASFYIYFCKGPYDGMYFKRNPDLKSLTFHEFIHRFLIRKPGRRFSHQRDFFHHPSSEKAPDYIGRFENYEADCRSILDHIGIHAPIIHSNKGAVSNYDYLIDDKAREMILEAYKADFEEFGYDENTNRA